MFGFVKYATVRRRPPGMSFGRRAGQPVAPVGPSSTTRRPRADLCLGWRLAGRLLGAADIEMEAMAESLRFHCDTMLHGLSRWLRAAGYDTSFEYRIAVDDLVVLCKLERRILLTSSGAFFDRNVVKSGAIRALFVPNAARPIDQFEIVATELDLSAREPCCMACGGMLREASKADVETDVPPRSLLAYERFWRCATCRKVFWQGTHWHRIAHRIAQRLEEARPLEIRSERRP